MMAPSISLSGTRTEARSSHGRKENHQLVLIFKLIAILSLPTY